MDEDQRSRQADSFIEREAEGQEGLESNPADPMPPPSPTPSPTPGPTPNQGGALRTAWLGAALIAGLSLLGFVIARLTGLLAGAALGALIAAALGLARR